ncbi:hypothetical protein Tco_1404418 [Tanacetum coccineum]
MYATRMVDNLDHLVDNLYTIWIGRLRLHANPIRYQRETKASPFKSTKVNEVFVKNSFAVVLKAGNQTPISSSESSLAIVLDDSKHVGVASWFNELLPASNSFVSNERIVWISVEGLPIKTWTRNMFAKIVTPWGKLSEVEAEDDSSLPFKKELDVWTPEFNNDLNDNSLAEGDFEDGVVEHISETKGSEGELVKEAKIDHVSEFSCMNNKEDEYENHGTSKEQKNNSEDPFGIYEILNRSTSSARSGSNHVSKLKPVVTLHLGLIKPNGFSTIHSLFLHTMVCVFHFRDDDFIETSDVTLLVIYFQTMNLQLTDKTLKPIKEGFNPNKSSFVRVTFGIMVTLSPAAESIILSDVGVGPYPNDDGRGPSFGDGNVMASSCIDSSPRVNEVATFATQSNETNNISRAV